MRGKYLFFDTETNDKAKDFKLPATVVDNWPRIVQIGFMLYDDNGGLLEEGEYIIKPDGWIITEESMAIHGITFEKAFSEGVPVEMMLNKIIRLLPDFQFLVAHNLKFDANVLAAEFIRACGENKLKGKNGICTMVRSTKFCAIDSPYGRGYKWPALKELHEILFNEGFDDAHDAVADIRATARCFWELKKRGIITR